MQVARCGQKAAQDRDARLATLQLGGSRAKLSALPIVLQLARLSELLRAIARFGVRRLDAAFSVPRVRYPAAQLSGSFIGMSRLRST